MATPVLRLRGGTNSSPGAGPYAHVTFAHGGGGGGGSGSAGGSRRLEPDPVAGVWARVSPSLLRPPLVFRSVAGAAAMAERGLEPSPAAVAALPPEVRAQLAELELELSEGRRAAGRASAGERAAACGRLGWRGSPLPTREARLGFHCCPWGARRTRGRVSWRQSCALRLTPCPSAAFLPKGRSGFRTRRRGTPQMQVFLLL